MNKYYRENFTYIVRWKSFDENIKIDDDENIHFNKQSNLEQVNDNNVEKVNDNTTCNDNILKSPQGILKNHPIDNVIGDINTKVLTRRQLNVMSNVAFISNIEPKNYNEAAKDEYWIIAMQEELN